VTDLAALQHQLGHRFKDETLLQVALTHPSVAHEASGPVQHNQRLEFLGDAVLGLVLTHELYSRYPHLGEGPLTKARARLVNRRVLAEEARRLRLGTYLLLGAGEEACGGRQRPSILADAFEAVIGALFIDGGLEAARQFILQRFEPRLGELTEGSHLDNPKGELQELLQAQSAEPPRYELTGVSGPDHDRLFECAVLHGGVELGRGQGKSKKAAETAAALAALMRLRGGSGSDSTVPQPASDPPDRSAS
jgi:ribonuclease-3